MKNCKQAVIKVDLVNQYCDNLVEALAKVHEHVRDVAEANRDDSDGKDIDDHIRSAMSACIGDSELLSLMSSPANVEEGV